MLVLFHNQTPQAFQFDVCEVQLLLKVLRKLSYESLVEIGLDINDIDKLNSLTLEMQN
jgi:hypothetical protein